MLILTSITTVDVDKLFPDDKCMELCNSNTHWKLFIKLKSYWNFLTYDLLDHLIENLKRNKRRAFKAVSKEMTEYKKDLKHFRERTTLKLFYKAGFMK